MLNFFFILFLQNFNFTFSLFIKLQAATNSEVSARRINRDSINNSLIRSDAAVAVLSKSNDRNESETRATLACVLPW